MNSRNIITHFPHISVATLAVGNKQQKQRNNFPAQTNLEINPRTRARTRTQTDARIHIEIRWHARPIAQNP